MKLNTLDRMVNWTKYVPYFLYRLGALQGWIDMYQAVAAKDYQSGQFDFHPVPFVSDLFENPNQDTIPSVPALAFKLEMDGTGTPSTENATALPKEADQEIPDPTQIWSEKLRNNLVEKPVSDHNAPNMGEFNNLLPPMFLDHNPEVQNQFEFAIYISVEARSKNDIMVNKKARRTRYDDRNYTASRTRDKAMFQLVQIVSNGLVKSPVRSLDDIEIRDKNGVRITQQWLDDRIAYMNGHKAIVDPNNPRGVKYSGRTLQETIL